MRQKYSKSKVKKLNLIIFEKNCTYLMTDNLRCIFEKLGRTKLKYSISKIKRKSCFIFPHRIASNFVTHTQIVLYTTQKRRTYLNILF